MDGILLYMSLRCDSADLKYCLDENLNLFHFNLFAGAIHMNEKLKRRFAICSCFLSGDGLGAGNSVHNLKISVGGGNGSKGSNGNSTSQQQRAKNAI